MLAIRWANKQYMPDDLFRNGDFNSIRLSVAECKSLLRRRGVRFDGLREKAELMEALEESTPLVSSRKPLPRHGKWKVSFAFAEADSQREDITNAEVSYFRWQLIYNGRPSTMGLRHFRADHVFVSPCFGETAWQLDGNGHFCMRGYPPLKVNRNTDNWGWVIGKGTGTEYHSVEVAAEPMKVPVRPG